jgi:hypothetical protein
VLPRQPGRIQIDGYPAQAGQAARDLRPGIDFPQDGQCLLVPGMRVTGVAALPGEISEAEQRPGNSPLVVDAMHDGDRGLGKLLRLSQPAL